MPAVARRATCKITSILCLFVLCIASGGLFNALAIAIDAGPSTAQATTLAPAAITIEHINDQYALRVSNLTLTLTEEGARLRYFPTGDDPNASAFSHTIVFESLELYSSVPTLDSSPTPIYHGNLRGANWSFETSADPVATHDSILIRMRATVALNAARASNQPPVPTRAEANEDPATRDPPEDLPNTVPDDKPDEKPDDVPDNEGKSPVIHDAVEVVFTFRLTDLHDAIKIDYELRFLEPIEDAAAAAIIHQLKATPRSEQGFSYKIREEKQTHSSHPSSNAQERLQKLERRGVQGLDFIAEDLGTGFFTWVGNYTSGGQTRALDSALVATPSAFECYFIYELTGTGNASVPPSPIVHDPELGIYIENIRTIEDAADSAAEVVDFVREHVNSIGVGLAIGTAVLVTVVLGAVAVARRRRNGSTLRLDANRYYRPPDEE